MTLDLMNRPPLCHSPIAQTSFPGAFMKISQLGGYEMEARRLLRFALDHYYFNDQTVASAL